MSDGLLHESAIKEGLSRVYVKALAAVSGYSTSEPDFDRDSVDLMVHGGGDRRPSLALQLKATATLKKSRRGTLPIRLKRKNYDDLRAESQVPRFLVVLVLPKDRTNWMTISNESLILRRCAYWLSLQGSGYEHKAGQESVTVHIPESQRLDAGALQELMRRSKEGVTA